jgi:magnesium chelatase family protein
MFEVLRYQKKVSGPLLDRIDLQISVPRVSVEALRKKSSTDRSELTQMRDAVAQARKTQNARLGAGRLNTEMTSNEVDENVELDQLAESFIRSITTKHLLSPRGMYRVLKTARTIADLEGRNKVLQRDVAEAFTYRLREQA